MHELYKSYPDGKIDVEKEQALVEVYGSLIWQFPVYWFNCTPLMKQWFDDVLTYGWAYGSRGTQLKDQKIGLAVSMGSSEQDYQAPYDLTAVLRPYEMTLHYVKANYQGAFSLFGANTDASLVTITPQAINQSAADFIEFLNKF